MSDADSGASSETGGVDAPPDFTDDWIELGPQGAEIVAEGDGIIAKYHLTIPPDVLGAGEQAFVRLAVGPPTEEDLAATPGYGVINMGAIELDVWPSELFTPLVHASEHRISLDLSSGDIPDEARDEALSDLAQWAEEQLVLGGPSRLHDNLDDYALSACSPELADRAYRVQIMRFARYNETTVPERVDLTIDARRAFPPGAARRGGAYANVSATRRVFFWIIDDGYHWTEDEAPNVRTHLGRISFDYYPVSVTSDLPVVPEFPEDQAEVIEACFGQIFDLLSKILIDHGFEPIRDEYLGELLGIRVWFYDFTSNPRAGAATDMRYRVIKLPTWMLEIPAAGCLNNLEERPTHRHAIAGIAHELFHMQQAAYLLPVDARYGAVYDDVDRWREVEVPIQYGSGGAETIEYRVNEWLLESTGRYFEQTLFPPIPQRDQVTGDHPLVALASYPIHGPAFDIVGSQFYNATTWYEYGRFFFIEFLLDQETQARLQRQDGYADELRLLAELWSRMGAETERSFGAGIPTELAPALQDWMAQRLDLEWFDFFRELALYHGCAVRSDCDCSAEADRGHPFARSENNLSPYFSGTLHDEDVFWADIDSQAGCFGFPTHPGRFPVYAESESYTSIDDDRTVYNAAGCFFDSAEAALHFDRQSTGVLDAVSAERALRRPTDSLPTETITLPRTLLSPLSGVRLDFLDDLTYWDGSVYTWDIEFAGDYACPHTLRYEAYLVDGNRLDGIPLASGTLGTDGPAIEFVTSEAPTSDERRVVLLVGNDTEWSLPEFIDPSERSCFMDVLITREVEGNARCGYCRELYPIFAEPMDPLPARDVLICNFAGSPLFFCDSVQGMAPDAGIVTWETAVCCWERAEELMRQYCGIESQDAIDAFYDELCSNGNPSACQCDDGSDGTGPICLGCDWSPG